MEQKTNVHEGHRKRVKEQFYKNKCSFKNMADHNILEMLLFFGIPYKDTNVIAHDLINNFGSFANVLRADFSDLQKVKGMTENAACLIKMMLPLFSYFSIEDTADNIPDLLTTEGLVKFIRPQFIDAVNERLFLICFGKNHKLICVKQLNEGDINKAYIDFRILASAVLETRAQSVVLVHNHPASIALPSPEDVEATKNVYNFLKTLKVRLQDHIIITANGHCSMANVPRYAHIFYGLDPIFDDDD